MDAIARRLSTAGSLLILTHARPDGDGLGSMVALALSAKAAGKVVKMLLPDAVPGRYELLFPDERPAPAEDFAALADEADLVVILDTCAFSQLDGLEADIRARREKVVVMDHHATRDDVGAAQWVDTSAAATGVLTGEVIEAIGWPMGLPAAEALTVAVASDTGWLQFANTDARCLRAVARWVDAGVRTDKLYRRLYLSDRPERIRLMQRALGSLELHCDGRLAVMVLRRKDFDQTRARAAETENIVNEALRMGRVEEAVLLVEEPDCVRASLRSRDDIDVAAVAQRFGGGGHARAAGLRANEDIDTLKHRLIAACREELDKLGPHP